MTTTKTNMALAELAEKGADADLLKQMIQYVAQRMMEMDAEGLCAAAYGERSPERLNSRNGYYSANYNECELTDGGGRIFHTSGTTLTCIDIAGKQLWQRTLRSSPLAIAADSKGRCYVTLNAGGMACYSRDGKEIWRNSSMHRFNSAMSVGEDDRVLVEADGELICIRQ